MIGVPYELFWDLDPHSIAPFVKAFEFKQKYDDTIAWQHGFYIQMAINSTFSKDEKYPKKPIFTNKEKITPEEQQKLIKERFIRHANDINQSRFGKEGVNGN